MVQLVNDVCTCVASISITLFLVAVVAFIIWGMSLWVHDVYHSDDQPEDNEE